MLYPFSLIVLYFVKLVYRKKCGYGNFNYWYNVSPIHLRARSGCGEFNEGGPRVRRPPMKWTLVTEVPTSSCISSLAYKVRSIFVTERAEVLSQNDATRNGVPEPFFFLK
jgi:hypothetical protein